MSSCLPFLSGMGLMFAHFLIAGAWATVQFAELSLDDRAHRDCPFVWQRWLLVSLVWEITLPISVARWAFDRGCGASKRGAA